MSKRNSFYVLISLIIIFFIWELLSIHIGSHFILPSPKLVISDLFNIILNKSLILDLHITLFRGVLSFLITLVFAFLIGTLSGIYQPFYYIFKPWMSIIKSTPVVSIILLAVLWLDFIKCK